MDAPRCPGLAGGAEDCVQVREPAAGAGRCGIPPRHPESMSPLHQRRDLGLGVLSLAPGTSGIPATVLTGELLVVSGVPAIGAVIAGLLAMRSAAPAVKALSIAGFALGVVTVWYVSPARWWAGRFATTLESLFQGRVLASWAGPLWSPTVAQRTSDAQAFGTDAPQTDGGMGACQCIGGNRTGRREADPTMSEAATSTSAPASRSRRSSYQTWRWSLTKIPIVLPSKSVRDGLSSVGGDPLDHVLRQCPERDFLIGTSRDKSERFSPLRRYFSGSSSNATLHPGAQK